MKRTCLVAALLVCAAACTAVAPTNTNNANASNVNTSNTNTASTATWTNDDIIAGDRQAWDFIKAKNYDAFAALLADDFVGVTSGKIMTKDDLLAYVKTFDLNEVNLSDFKVVRIDNDAAVVTYTVNDKGTVGGKPIPTDSKGMRHSTAKVMRGGKWLAVYHQGTPIMSMPSVPPAGVSNTNAVNSNNASPVASPAATTADAEANEKAAWAAIKAKNYDAFAGYLAEDFLEVEPDQVYTKSASVEGVKRFDASKFELSDFRSVTLDADAKLVTYTVKGPGPGGKTMTELDSTIWTNRGGKWLAVFHQSTPVTTDSL